MRLQVELDLELESPDQERAHREHTRKRTQHHLRNSQVGTSVSHDDVTARGPSLRGSTRESALLPRVGKTVNRVSRASDQHR